MNWPRSLQLRLGLILGLSLSLLWLAAASITTVTLRQEMNEVFDAALQETAERLLPLAVVEIIGREDQGITQRLGAIRADEVFFSYVVRDAEGQILLQSHGTDAAIFPPYDGRGFRETATHRLFNDAAVQDSIRISVAEPLHHRATVARDIQMGLVLPLLAVLPLTFLAIFLALGTSLAPLRRFREQLAARSPRDLSPVPTRDLPSEIAPLALTLNSLLNRLQAAFDAERGFASNAAHELRTPLAGAIAQAQRLQAETADPAAAARAADIEATLKRLTRLSERLMQLARAEGGRLIVDRAYDLRMVMQMIVDDMRRTEGKARIMLALPDQPVMSVIDPDALGILCRNLIENGLRHGAEAAPVEVTLSAAGQLHVSNAGVNLPQATLSRLTRRFERASSGTSGSGLGLAIVAAIADRIGGQLELASPRSDGRAGFEASVSLPLQAAESAG